MCDESEFREVLPGTTGVAVMKTVGWLLTLVLLTGCSTGQTSLVTVYPNGLDPTTRAFVEKELSQLLAVTEHPNFEISVTVEETSVGLGGGRAVATANAKGEITIRPSAVANAMKSQAALWSLRLVLAHELGHVMASHWFTHTSRQPQKELEADKLGLGYFKRLGWSCKVWVDRFRRQSEQGSLSPEHDAKARYEQASQLCAIAGSSDNPIETQERK